MRVEQMRAQTLHAYSQINGGRNGSGAFSGGDLASRAGGTDTIFRGVTVSDGPSRLDADLAAAAIAAQPPRPIGILPQILRAVDILLGYYSQISMAPTKAARGGYLFFHGIASAYSWCTASVAVSGVKGGWDWDRKTPLDAEADQAVFITQCAHIVLSGIVPSYSPDVLNGGLTPQQRASIDSIKQRGAFESWAAAWAQWWTARGQDGSIAASAPPATSVYPNGSTRLEVSQQQDFTDSTAYPNPASWTPLAINGTFKPWLTRSWNSVQSTDLSADQEDSVKRAAAVWKLSSSSSEREAELNTLYMLSQSLTDTQKVTAEFWAGGPSTPSPPGIALWIWRVAMEAIQPGTYAAIYSGLELAISLFEASRLIWGLKTQYTEARPIQEIRRIYANQTAIRYDGASISTALWVPFQMPNFVTPPFPDFPSGHSGFSQTLANVMTRWFGADVPSQTITVNNADTVAPLLPATIDTSLRSFTVSTGASEIQPGLVPAAPVVLEFPTWQSMAESAGVSRQYGGIHCISAHKGGQEVANTLYPILQDVWGILKQ